MNTKYSVRPEDVAALADLGVTVQARTAVDAEAVDSTPGHVTITINLPGQSEPYSIEGVRKSRSGMYLLGYEVAR